MGEIADMMLDGTMCQECGEFMDAGEPAGYPVTCAGCIGDGLRPEDDLSSKPKDPRTVECPEPLCERRFVSRRAAAQHWADKH